MPWAYIDLKCAVAPLCYACTGHFILNFSRFEDGSLSLIWKTGPDYQHNLILDVKCQMSVNRSKSSTDIEKITVAVNISVLNSSYFACVGLFSVNLLSVLSVLRSFTEAVLWNTPKIINRSLTVWCLNCSFFLLWTYTFYICIITCNVPLYLLVSKPCTCKNILLKEPMENWPNMRRWSLPWFDFHVPVLLLAQLDPDSQVAVRPSHGLQSLSSIMARILRFNIGSHKLTK